MQEANNKKVPEPTLKRLPAYLHYLQKAREKGVMNISAPAISKELNCDPTQVVKDISFTGAKGKPRLGYNTYELIHAIESFLGFHKTNEAFLVGAGNLGSALMSYQYLKAFGLKIVAAFDVDQEKIGLHKGSVSILHMDKFHDLAKRLKIQIGILTTPAEVAQEVADRMVQSGIKAIWNLTPLNLSLPDDIIVQNTSMYSNVAVLLKRLHDSERKEKNNI